MTDLWQHVLVAAAALAAAVWLVVLRIRKRREAAKCDTCALAQALTTRPRDER